MTPSTAHGARPSPTAQPFSLRPYQRDAIHAVLAARRAGARRLLVCLPTGSGKTVIFSELARMARRPVLVLAHRSELVEQARDKLARALGDPAAVGVEQADQRAAPGCRVVVASIRSLHPERLSQLTADRDFGLVIYDECHHAPAEGNRAVLEGLGCFTDGWSGTLLGFTATTQRGDGKGLDKVFETIAFTRSIREMVADGFLCALRGFRIATAADLSAVSGRDDFVVEELAEAIDIQERNALVARTIQELARDRRTIAFCVTVAHATNLARALNHLGVRAGIVHGQLRSDDRARVLADFRSGRLQALTNVGVLTEGFDDPEVSCIAMARPTRSEGLYTQCVGRGTRLAPGKKNCLVLDFVDLGDLSLVTLPTLAGLPRHLDLQGDELADAQERMATIWQRHPGFEVDPGSITLDEIERRAASFDPLTLETDPEVRAISPHAWHSLGSRGLALHVFRTVGRLRQGRLTELLILDRGGRGKRWQVRVDGRDVARFSRVEEAVEACDYEVRQMGRVAAGTALPGSPWREGPVPADLGRMLSSCRPPLHARQWGEAAARLAYRQHGPKGRPR